MKIGKNILEGLKNFMKFNQSLINFLAKRDTDIAEHIPIFCKLVKKYKPKVLVELGRGQSTFVFATLMKDLGQFYSIDFNRKSVCRLFPEGGKLMLGLNRMKHVHFIDGDDMDIVKTWDKDIDILFIDTSHTYEHTKGELNTWCKHVSGVVILHDTDHKDPIFVGCRKALDEFLLENKGYTVEHIKDKIGCGLSILIKK